MNVIDLVAIIPFYLNILLEGLEDFEIIGKKKLFNCLLFQIILINPTSIRGRGCCVWHGGGYIVPPLNISASGRARGLMF